MIWSSSLIDQIIDTRWYYDRYNSALTHVCAPFFTTGRNPMLAPHDALMCVVARCDDPPSRSTSYPLNDEEQTDRRCLVPLAVITSSISKTPQDIVWIYWAQRYIGYCCIRRTSGTWSHSHNNVLAHNSFYGEDHVEAATVTLKSCDDPSTFYLRFVHRLCRYLHYFCCDLTSDYGLFKSKEKDQRLKDVSVGTAG